MAYRVHVTLTEAYEYPEWYTHDNSGYNIFCSDYIIRRSFIVLKDAEIVLKNDVKEFEAFYIGLDYVQDFTVDRGVELQ